MELGIEKSIIETNSEFISKEATVADPVVMFALLTKLYNDITRIIVQEYIANARDAHREKNIPDRPIEITLPTLLHKAVSYRDFGPGISPERIENVFINLGTSTKRGDNLQTGGFGIGAKCVFAYTDSLSIDTYIGGIHRVYEFMSGDNGIPKIILINEEETTEEDGTKITIWLKNSQDVLSVSSNVYKLTQFWDVRPIIVNEDVYCGNKWKNFEVIEEGANWKYYRNGDKTSVVLDGIPYRFDFDAVYNEKDDKKYSQIFSNDSFYFFFNTGEVTVSPNREGLFYDTKTVIAIRNAVDDAIDGICKKISSYIDTIDNIFDAYEAITKYAMFELMVGKITWNGLDLNNFVFDSNFYKVKKYRMYRNKPRQYEPTNILINKNLKYVFCDEEEIYLSRIRTIALQYDLNNYYFIKPVSFEECEEINDETKFNNKLKEYNEKLRIDTINFIPITNYPKHVNPKTPKNISNVYKFLRQSRKKRMIWENLLENYGELDGYFVEFIRGEANGYSIDFLDFLVRTYNIAIYGVPTRMLKKAENADNLIPLSEFIQEKYNEYEEDMKINVKDYWMTANQNTYSSMVKSISKLPRWLAEVIKECSSYKKLFEVYEEYSKFYSSNGKNTKLNNFKQLLRSAGKTDIIDLKCPQMEIPEIMANDDYFDELIRKDFPILKSLDIWDIGRLDKECQDYFEMRIEKLNLK